MDDHISDILIAGGVDASDSILHGSQGFRVLTSSHSWGTYLRDGADLKFIKIILDTLQEKKNTNTYTAIEGNFLRFQMH